MPFRTRLQIATILLATAGATIVAARSTSGNWLGFWSLLFVVLVTSGLKVSLPRGDGTMSLNFPFILLGIMQLSPVQAMIIAGTSVAAQCLIRVEQIFSAVQITFNIANAMLSTACAYFTFALLRLYGMATAPALGLASVSYFLCNTISLSLVISSSKGERFTRFWRGEFPWYLPFYLVGAALAATVHWMSHRFGWGTALLLVPVVYTLYRAYMGQRLRIQERQQHLEETEALHLRTIEGLAMAIEAKDQNTHDHLFRVRHYVKAVGQALRLDKLEMQALETAAFLHDIGKLAVPEHIINKPGKLTPEEFEKMKIHPVVGADILERVRFPYPVVPVVRSHHEWWNGTGYPDGLKGSDIPIGARILTGVDCFDALVSDRPYRKGRSGTQALDMIRNLSGKQFDPTVVEAFERCRAESQVPETPVLPSAFTPLNMDVDVSRGIAPGAGYQSGSEPVHSAKASVVPELHAAGEPGQEQSPAVPTYEAEIAFDDLPLLRSSLTPHDLVAVTTSRLQRFVPFDVCALYRKTGNTIELSYAVGHQNETFPAPVIQLGEGISGWVAQSGKPILNGNAAVEPGSPSSADGQPLLRSGLSIPLLDPHREVFAVLTLYAAKLDPFSREHLQLLVALESRISLALHSALCAPSPKRDPEVDKLTQLPGAERFFVQMESQLDQPEGRENPVAVVICGSDLFMASFETSGSVEQGRVIRLVAHQLQQLCVAPEMVTRLGTGEFTFLLPGSTQADIAMRQREIRSAVLRAVRSATGKPDANLAIGSAFYPADGTTTEDLLGVAKRRMHLEKRQHEHRKALVPATLQSTVPAV